MPPITEVIANLKGSSQVAGDKIPQHVHVVDASGNPVSFGGSGGTSETDGGSFVPDTTLGTPAMGGYEATPTTLSDGEIGIIGLTQDREVKVSVTSGGTAGTQYTEGDTDASITGTALMMEGAANGLVAATGTAANGLDVDVTRVSGTVTVDGSGVTQPVSNAGTFPVQVDGAALTALQLIDNIVQAEDAIHGSGNSGVMALAVRSDAGGAFAADGDYVPLSTDSNGALRVTGGGGGTEYTEGDTDTTFTGGVVLAEGPSNAATPLLVDGSQHLQVDLAAASVGIIANAGTNLNTSALALESGGNLAAIAASASVLDDWDESDRAKVNIISGQAGVAAGAGSVSATVQRVTLASDDPGVTALQLLDNAISGSEMQVDVVAALPAGTNNIGDVDVLSVVPGTTATALGKAEDAAHTTGDTGVMVLGVRAAAPTERSAGPTDGDYEPFGTNEVGAVWGTLTPSANGGCTIFRSLDIDETEEEIKATAGAVYGYFFGNVSASVRYLKFYNATAANVTVGSTTPVLTFPLPAASSGHISFPYGLGFATAITVACTTGVADADTGAPSANDVVINVFYK